MLIHQKVMLNEVNKRIKELENENEVEIGITNRIIIDGKLRALNSLKNWIGSKEWDEAIRDEYLKQEKEKIKN